MNLIFTRTNTKDASLYALVFFNISLLLFRMVVTETIFYAFLAWNLILAGVPYLTTYIMKANDQTVRKNYLLFAFSFVWLLFLPNAPYIITDFLHFKMEAGMPEWFDILLLTTFSFSGLLFGFLSIDVMRKLWQRRFGAFVSWIFIACSCLLSGFGIFLGRFLRYNSWDIISNPRALITDIPMQLFELRAVGFSIGYGFFVLLFYFFIKTHASKI